ncbi:MAG: hypothetical protein KAQ87_00580 [Candidatus Pacebacteria bacterium]|nr:hypothetical protein [Candidatus Paceibacterota bacterium]
MKFNLVKIKKTIGRLRAKISQEIVFSFLAIIIFLYVFYSALFGFELSESEISEYMKPFRNNCAEYNDSINNVGANIKNLVEDDQIKELKYYDDLIDEKSYDKRKDPFSRSL